MFQEYCEMYVSFKQLSLLGKHYCRDGEKDIHCIMEIGMLIAKF